MPAEVNGTRPWFDVEGPGLVPDRPAVVLLSRWAESHDVVPVGAGRRLLVAAAAWFGVHLVVIGPLVRWQAGQSLGWWSLAAAVMASPFLVGAWLERGRSGATPGTGWPRSSTPPPGSRSWPPSWPPRRPSSGSSGTASS